MLLKVLMVSWLALCWAKNIDTKPQKHIEIEVGQAYDENIPLLFKRFQHTELSSIKRQVPFHEEPICEIKPASPAELREVSSLAHGATQQKQRQQMIYDFQDIKARRAFIDAIKYKSQLIALYYPNQIIFYSFELTTGILNLNHTNILQGRTINDAKFVINQEQILLFTNDYVLKVNFDGVLQAIKGYEPTGRSFDDVASIDHFIYIAGGTDGVVTYTFNSTSLTIQKISISTFFDFISNNTVSFDANRIYIDHDKGLAYVLDRQIGLISVSLQKMRVGGQVKAHELKVLMGGCENMVVTTFSIFLTCPELVELNRQAGGVQRVIHNSFYVYEMRLAGERIFLYGHQETAVYDIYGNILQEHSLGEIAEESFLLEDYIVSFFDWGVTSSFVIPQQEKLHCYTDLVERAGTYTGKYSTMGLCKELFYEPQNNNQICQISYPFALKVANSAFNDYKLQIILVGSFILLFTLAGLFLAVRHHCVHKAYKELVEQESRENIELQVQPQPPKEKRKELE